MRQHFFWIPSREVLTETTCLLVWNARPWVPEMLPSPSRFRLWTEEKAQKWRKLSILFPILSTVGNGCWRQKESVRNLLSSRFPRERRNTNRLHLLCYSLGFELLPMKMHLILTKMRNRTLLGEFFFFLKKSNCLILAALGMLSSPRGISEASAVLWVSSAWWGIGRACS